ncbi:ciliated left-right organizer protein containing ZP-N domains homolog isoform X2 [Nelusetta ayraudi]|uniref:ciliated left-right organizer protein containing ZP-N domains homolog isoform X2 n=1 Tax=Nelusetta ayraudi TaxID=303726 RepID=UPI003F727A5A
MELMRSSTLFRLFVFHIFVQSLFASIQEREWINNQTTELTGADMVCFSEYMEKKIPDATREEVGVWLSDALHGRVNLTSLDHLDLQLSACGLSLHKDLDNIFILRVSYSGCLVQQQHGYYVLTLDTGKRMSRYGGRPHSLLMKCPVAPVLPSQELIQCDPEFIQVTRQLPRDNWDNELQWSLSLSDQLIVALEDASLIQMNAALSGPNITLQGRRKEVLSPLTVTEEDSVKFLALKLISGPYAFSMEATCPKVGTAREEEAELYIFKRHMGLTKRGSHGNGGLTVSEVLVQQTDNFTVHDTSQLVTLVIPTAQILQTKPCTEKHQLLQPFYRVDVVLSFKETNHKMHWSVENTLPCTVLYFGEKPHNSYSVN